MEKIINDQREKDIRKVCKALLYFHFVCVTPEQDEWVHCRYCKSSGVMAKNFRFLHRGEQRAAAKRIKHDIYCPVLIAKDLLT